MNQSGQATIEAAAAASAFVALFSLVLMVCYLCTIRVWIDYIAHETAICIAKDLSESLCKRKYMGQLESYLLRESSGQITIRKTRRSVRVTTTINIVSQQLISIQELDLPLKESAL